MTYGALRLRIKQLFPDLGNEVIDGFISDRYAEILGEIPWSRMQAVAILQTTAPYLTGTVALANGSNSVVGSGTTWASAMTGRAFRVPGRDEIYQFVPTSTGAATLDRAYEGPSVTGGSYVVFQSVYPLPLDCRLLEDDAFSDKYGPLDRMALADLNASVPNRTSSGTPRYWASYMDDGSSPPRMQVELYPIPDAVLGIPFTYTAEADALGSTSAALQAWIQPTALIEGVQARCCAHLKDYTGAEYHNALAEKALKQMRSTEEAGMGPARIQLDSYYTRHRNRRGC